METIVEVRAEGRGREAIPVKLVSSFQRDVPICVFPADVARALAARFLDSHRWVAGGWKSVSGVASHGRKDHRVRG